MEVVVYVLSHIAGIVVGAMGYRYLLKRNPAKIEQWATDIRNAKAEIKARIDD